MPWTSDVVKISAPAKAFSFPLLNTAPTSHEHETAHKDFASGQTAVSELSMFDGAPSYSEANANLHAKPAKARDRIFGFHRSLRHGPEQCRTPHLSKNGTAFFLSRWRLQYPCCCKGGKLTRCCEERECCGSRQHGTSTAAERQQKIRQEAEDDTGGQASQLSVRSSASSHRRRERPSIVLKGGVPCNA